MQEKNAKLPSFYFGGSTGFQGYGYNFKGQAYAIGQLGMKWDIFHPEQVAHFEPEYLYSKRRSKARF
jgi:hypothetical protein